MQCHLGGSERTISRVTGRDHTSETYGEFYGIQSQEIVQFFAFINCCVNASFDCINTFVLLLESSQPAPSLRLVQFSLYVELHFIRVQSPHFVAWHPGEEVEPLRELRCLVIQNRWVNTERRQVFEVIANHDRLLALILDFRFWDLLGFGFRFRLLGLGSLRRWRLCLRHRDLRYWLWLLFNGLWSWRCGNDRGDSIRTFILFLLCSLQQLLTCSSSSRFECIGRRRGLPQGSC